MNIATQKVICAICGGEGIATMQTASYAWKKYSPVVIKHANPDICRRILALKKSL